MSETAQAELAGVGAVAGAPLRYGTPYELRTKEKFLSWKRGWWDLALHPALDVESATIVFLDENGKSPAREIRSGDIVVVQLQRPIDRYLICYRKPVRGDLLGWDLWGRRDPTVWKKFLIWHDGDGSITGEFRLGWSGGNRTSGVLGEKRRWVTPGPREKGIWWTADPK